MSPAFFGRVFKNGSSLGIVVPREICKAVPIERGDTVAVVLRRDGVMTVTKVDPRDLEKEIDA